MFFIFKVHVVIFSLDDKDTAMLLEEKGANVHERDREGHSGRDGCMFSIQIIWHS